MGLTMKTVTVKQTQSPRLSNARKILQSFGTQKLGLERDARNEL